MNKQKADNLSDVTPWPLFIFREGIFLQLLGKVLSFSHETAHVSSERFSCSDAQIALCVWTTRYHVRPCLWHNHLISNGGGGERIFILAKAAVSLTKRGGGGIFRINASQMNKSLIFRDQELEGHVGRGPALGFAYRSPLNPCFMTSNPIEKHTLKIPSTVTKVAVG